MSCFDNDTDDEEDNQSEYSSTHSHVSNSSSSVDNQSIYSSNTSQNSSPPPTYRPIRHQRTRTRITNLTPRLIDIHAEMDEQARRYAIVDEKLGPAENIPQWEDVPFDNIDFADCQEIEETDDPKYCFRCCHTQNAKQMENNDYMKGLMRMMSEHIGLVHPFSWTRQIQSFYNAHIRLNVKGYGFNRVWTCRQIWEHLTIHAPTEHSITEFVLRDMNQMLCTIRNGGLKKVNKTDGTQRLDPTIHKMYMETWKEMKGVIKICETLRPRHVN